MTKQVGKVLFVSGWYDAGMRDFHLALMKDWTDCRPVSVIRLPRDMPKDRLREEHHDHGCDELHVFKTTKKWASYLSRLLPIFALYVLLQWLRHRPKRMIVTNDGYCFWSVPSVFLRRRASVFYHDPKPHETADAGSRKSRFENRYKKWVHESKRWASVLIGSEAYLEGLRTSAKSPVELIEFPRFTKYLFPKGPLPKAAGSPGYILIYGRIDVYKGVYDWLKSMQPHFEQLPPILLAGLVVDKRVYEFEGQLRMIDRFIAVEEVWGLFENASAVVLPYTSVTHSGIGDIAVSFGVKTYLPDLDYFTRRYTDDPNARNLGDFLNEMRLREIAP